MGKAEKIEQVISALRGMGDFFRQLKPKGGITGEVKYAVVVIQTALMNLVRIAEGPAWNHLKQQLNLILLVELPTDGGFPSCAQQAQVLIIALEEFIELDYVAA